MMKRYNILEKECKNYIERICNLEHKLYKSKKVKKINTMPLLIIQWSRIIKNTILWIPQKVLIEI